MHIKSVYENMLALLRTRIQFYGFFSARVDSACPTFYLKTQVENKYQNECIDKQTPFAPTCEVGRVVFCFVSVDPLEAVGCFKWSAYFAGYKQTPWSFQR